MGCTVLLTNDVETTSIANGILSDEAGKLVSEQGLPRLLELYEKFNIKSTFFYTGYIAKLYPNVVRLAVDKGHEIGCHGLSHKAELAFDTLQLDEQIRHLTEAKKILEDISGHEVISFRAPALRVNNNTPVALSSAGFKIDSSIASQRFDMFLSHGSKLKLKCLIAPRLPYRTKPNDLFKKGNGNIIEVPLSAILFPYIGTTLRIFPVMTNIVRKLLIIESKINKKPINFLIHPNELIDEPNLTNNKIENRSKNIITYFLADFLRHRLKLKNLGSEALPLYEREIQKLKSESVRFLTVSQYVNELDL
jgi:peptidoglycan/xylan/chitin deacetylase (PgdA/CDA1 family)